MKRNTRNTKTKAETVTIPEAAERLGIGRNTAYECAARGELPTIRLGKRLVVPVAALNRMLEGGGEVDHHDRSAKAIRPVS